MRKSAKGSADKGGADYRRDILKIETEKLERRNDEINRRMERISAYENELKEAIAAAKKSKQAFDEQYNELMTLKSKYVRCMREILKRGNIKRDSRE